jgi:hypothetical protein
LVSGVDAGSFFTIVLGVDPDEWDAIRHVIHELSCRCNTEGTTGGVIPRTG